MAGILDFLGLGGSPQGGILGVDPNAGAFAPPPAWASKVGMFGAGLADAGATLSGHPADATNTMRMQLLQRQNALRQAYSTAATATDPNIRQQAYGQILAAGGDPKAIQDEQAAKAMPAMLSAMQPQTNINPVPVTPQVTTPTAQGQAAPTVDQRLQSMGPATTTTAGLPMLDAMKATGSPELAQMMAPDIMNQQMQIAAKSLRPASAAQKIQGGYGANDPVMTDVYGNLSSPVKPQVAVQQGFNITANTPRTPEDIAKDRIAQSSANAAMISANKPIVTQIGSILSSPITGQPLGGMNAMGLPMTKGNVSSNITDYPPQMQGVIRGMLNGTIAPPQGAALRAPQTLQLIEAAAAVDPSFDETKWTARNKMAGDAMGNGAWGKGMNALGTATQHVAALGNYGQGTFNTTLPSLNWALNTGASALGSPGKSVYEDTAHKVGEEYTRAYRGAGGSEADIKSSMDALSPNASQQTKDAVINENMNLARDKMAENVQQYNRTMGTNKQISDFVSPQTVSAYAARGIDINSGKAVAPSQSASPPPSPQNLPRLASPAASPQDIVDELRKRGIVK